MTDNTTTLRKIQAAILSAENQLNTAKAILADMLGESPQAAAQTAARRLAPAVAADAGGHTVEGVFDGQKMVDGTGKSYPVPSNYASKSKLVQNQPLKLTITEDGKFIYKQIALVPQKTVIGPLTYENGQYKVLAEGKNYKILLASITFYRASIGDDVVVLVPAEGEAEWGAVDNVIPKGS